MVFVKYRGPPKYKTKTRGRRGDGTGLKLVRLRGQKLTETSSCTFLIIGSQLRTVVTPQVRHGWIDPKGVTVL